jgi:hypothetical protein
MLKPLFQTLLLLLIVSCTSPVETIQEYAKSVKNGDTFETTIKSIKQVEGEASFEVTTSLIKIKDQTNKCYKTKVSEEEVTAPFEQFEAGLLTEKFIKQDSSKGDTITVFYGWNAYPEVYSEPDERRRLQKISEISRLIDFKIAQDKGNIRLYAMSVVPKISYSVTDFKKVKEKIIEILTTYDRKQELVLVKLVRSGYNNKSTGVYDLVYPENYTGAFHNYFNRQKN